MSEMLNLSAFPVQDWCWGNVIQSFQNQTVWEERSVLAAGGRARVSKPSATNWYQTLVESGPCVCSASDRIKWGSRHRHLESMCEDISHWAGCWSFHLPGARRCNCPQFTSKFQAGLAASRRPRIQAWILGRLRACADNLRGLWTWGECQYMHLFSNEHQAGLAGEQEAHGEG